VVKFIPAVTFSDPAGRIARAPHPLIEINEEDTDDPDGPYDRMSCGETHA